MSAEIIVTVGFICMAFMMLGLVVHAVSLVIFATLVYVACAVSDIGDIS